LKKASSTKKHGMRYDTEFLMECLLLMIRSKKAYMKIRERRLLPLPSISTLRRLLSCMPCSFGLNEFALNAIKKNLEGKTRAMRYGSLVWDEMAIKEDLTFNSQKLQFDGHVDYGDQIKIQKHAGQLADHTLLLVFRPYLSSWIQPFAVYATKGAAPGDSLHELLCKAIVALQSHGAIVKSVVCDGAQSNKRVMHLFGVTGKSDDSPHTFALPHQYRDPIKQSPAVPLQEKENCPIDFNCARNESHPTDGTSCDVVDDIDALDLTDLEDWPEVIKEKEVNEANGNGSDNDDSDSSFENITEPEERIFFFVDVPHLFKCVRNYIFNKKDLQV
jgi:hypothetical protein